MRDDDKAWVVLIGGPCGGQRWEVPGPVLPPRYRVPARLPPEVWAQYQRTDGLGTFVQYKNTMKRNAAGDVMFLAVRSDR